MVDNYGYMEPVEKNKNQPNPYSEPYSDNTTAGYINTNGIPEYKSKFVEGFVSVVPISVSLKR